MLLGVDWSFLYTLDNVNTAVSALYDKLYELFDVCIPLYKVNKSNGKYPSWYTYDIIRDIKEKSRLHKKWKSTRSLAVYDEYKRKRSLIKGKIRISYRTFIDKSEQSLTGNPKNFWKFFHQKSRKSRVPGSMTYSGVELRSTNEIVRSFARCFESAFTQSRKIDKDTFIEEHSSNNIAVNSLSETEILGALRSQKNKLLAGHDQIPSFLLRDCAGALATPLAYIFNLSLKTKTFPNA